MESEIIFRKEVINPIIEELLKNGYYIIDRDNKDLVIINSYLNNMEKNGNLLVDGKADIVGEKYNLTEKGRELLLSKK